MACVSGMVLLVLLCVGGSQCGSLRRPLSAPLSDFETYRNVQIISRHAQQSETENDTSIRLIPHANTTNLNLTTTKHHLEVCCLHANILDFYLRNILHPSDNQHTKMNQLKTDLARVSSDLQQHGCNVTQYQDHQNAVQFRRKLTKMGGRRGINKAIGEIDILFTYLQDYCIHV